MSQLNEIIVLDDNEDEEEPPHPAAAEAVSCHSSNQTNGKEEESHPSKAQVISAQNKALFNEFIEYCSKLTSDHPEVISFLQGRYIKANPSYLSSVEFQNTLSRCLTRVQAKRSKIFVYINELCTALKANTQKRKVSLQTQTIQLPSTEKTEVLKENDGEVEDTPVKKTGSKRQIRYLENLLREYSQEIKKLQEKEMSLEELEDEDSSYIQESKLKRKLLRIFEKLCDLKDCSSLTGRVIEQRILYRGTRYPEVNRRLEKFINSSRDLFPDYGDVLRVVERANDKHGLGLMRKQMQSMAQDAFRELGNKLQDRRHLDMVYNFGCHLTDTYKSVHDPAQLDTSLSRRLRENRNMALSHLDEIIRKYADLQDDGEGDYRMKTRKGSERNRQSSSERSEEDEESEESDTDIEEELKESNKMPDSEEGENEEEEISANQENEADQKMDLASDEDRDKEKEDGDEETDNVMEEATEQESSPASTSSSQDKDSPNTTLESEVEAQLSGSSGLPSSPAIAKSNDEHNEEQDVCDTTGEPVDESEEPNGLVPSSVDNEPTEIKGDSDVILDSKANDENHKSAQNYLLPNIRALLEDKDEDNSELDGKDVTEPTDDPPCEESDAEIDSEQSSSPVIEEESVNTEETSVKRISPDSEAASMEEEEEELVCTDAAGDHDHDDTAASDCQRSSDSSAATKVHTEAADLDPCGNVRDCKSSPLGSSNGVQAATPVRRSSVNRLRLNKDKASHRNSHKPRKTEEDSPTPYRKRKWMSSENWAQRNGLKRHNGKKPNEDHMESNRKRMKMDCSFTALASSSNCDSDEDDETPGLMMTCSPRETPIKKTRKAHVFTQCDPDEVIVLSD